MFNMTFEQLLNFEWLQLRVGPVLLFILFVAALLIGLILFWRGNNRLSALDNRCTTADADIDAQMKHRHNLIPGLVETVRGYLGHEHKVLLAVTKANAAALQASSRQMRFEAETQLGNSITSLLQAAHKYPELKASAHFQELQRQLIDVENRVTAARRFFNLATEEYNNQLGSFPSNLLAKLQKRARRSPYSVEAAQRAEINAPLAFKF
ncbi:MAG: LemA family protein [Allosphingosinicella sp.]|uniref:LemA family protein n=1 Tax=Allosphingosinicella sp. TaxID=2823234 RepID=UPI0039382F13